MHRDSVRIAVLLLLALAAYGNSFHAAFQFDDYNVIVDNANVHSLTAWWRHALGIRPLLKLSYTLNWISGLGVSGFHLVNFALHCANTVLIYLLLKRFPASDAHRAGETAFVAALLFALLTIQTEAVTYISGRSVSLMTLFYLMAVLAYARGRDRQDNRLSKVVSPLLFVAALLVKEVAVTLPLALLLWEKAHGTSTRLALRHALPHWLLLGLAGLFLLALRDYAGLFAYSFSLRSSGDNLLTQIHAVSYLLTRPFALWGHNIDPDLPLIRHWSPLLLAEALLLAGLLALGLRQLQHRPWLGFGILWLLLHLLPTNSLVPRLDVANERQLYLGSIGVCFMGANIFSAVAASRPAWRGWLNGALAGWLLLLTLATLARNHDYRSEIALWEDTVAHSPAKARPWNNLGHAYALAGDNERAQQAYRKAIQLKPDYALALKNLAAVEKASGAAAPNP
jgi:tetratricopeptide (TPR) repeat protein